MPNADSYHRRNLYILLYSHLSTAPQTVKHGKPIEQLSLLAAAEHPNGMRMCAETLQTVCMRPMGWAGPSHLVVAAMSSSTYPTGNVHFLMQLQPEVRKKSCVSREMFHTTNSFSSCSSKVLRTNSSRFASSSGDFTLGLEAITTMLLRIWTPKTVNSVSNVSRSRMVSLAMLSKTKNFRHLVFASATATATRCAASWDVNRSLVSKQPGVSRSGPRIESNNSGHSVTDSPLPSPTAGHFSSIDLRSWQTMVDLVDWLGPKRIKAWASESPQKGERLPVPAGGARIRPSRRSSWMGWTGLGSKMDDIPKVEKPFWGIQQGSKHWKSTKIMESWKILDGLNDFLLGFQPENLPTEACTPLPLLSSPLLWHSQYLVTFRFPYWRIRPSEKCFDCNNDSHRHLSNWMPAWNLSTLQNLQHWYL